jgi:hypothetical protein
MSKQTLASLTALVEAQAAAIALLITRIEKLESQPSKPVRTKVTHEHKFVGTYNECAAFCKQNLEHQPSPERIDDTTFGVFFRK